MPAKTAPASAWFIKDDPKQGGPQTIACASALKRDAAARHKRRICLIATEESGDRLGSALMKVLRQRLGDGAFRIAHAALAKSGTVTLELALSGIPMVTAYRVGAVKAFILRRAIRVSSVIPANLVIGRDVIPEYLQEDCTPEKLTLALQDVLTDSPLRRQQVGAFAQLDRIMSTGNKSPSVLAADIVLATMHKGGR